MDQLRSTGETPALIGEVIAQPPGAAQVTLQ
jgi:hypothetical protein